MPSIDINTNFCTLEDASYATQALVEQIQNIYNVLDTGGVLADTFKVSVNEDDVGPDFLHAKIDQSGVTGYEGTIPVFSETIGDSTERFIADLRSVANYTTVGSDTQFLSINGAGELSFTTVGTSVDTNMVMVTSGDSTPSYLHDAFDLNAAYVANADLLVATETVGWGGTNQKERPFVDVSAIAGYSAEGTFFLALVNNVTTYVDASDLVAGGISAGYAMDASGSTLSFDPTEITGFAAEFQFFMHLAAATGATDPAWKTIANYDPAKNQIQWHQSGDFKFQTVEGYDATKTQALSHVGGNWKFLRGPVFAITTEAIPAATGNYTSGPITPGKTTGSSNIRLYDYGTNYGDGASQGALAKAENYMRGAVSARKGVYVWERAPDIWVIPSEGCQAFPSSGS